MGHPHGKRPPGMTPPACPGQEGSSAGPHPAAGTEVDGLTTAQPPGDPNDVSAWEAAWIDLGGEG